MIGRQLSHFQITAELGAGGMGVVYKAVDLRLQRNIALKVLRLDLGPDAESRSRFLSEARAASALNHPGIVTVHEVDRADGVDFIAMELLEGLPLDALIAGAPLDLDEALGYAIEIAESLGCAHEAGIVHREVKPRNVMVTTGGRVKVLDFGIAKRLSSSSGGSDAAMATLGLPPETATGLVMGTPQYMSPEQALGKRVDARSDIFSFGVLFYEMLGGQPPFTGGSVAEVITALLRDEPPPLRRARPELPEDVERILVRMLEKDPDRRYQRMQEVLADLQALRRSAGTVSATASPAAPKRSAAIALLVGAAIVAAVTSLAFFLRGWRARPPSYRFHQISTAPGTPRSPSFSPDGKMLAYVDDADGVPHVWVRYVQEGAPVQVTSGPVPEARPRWSPKGDAIVFERRGQGVWSVPPLGGQTRQIVSEGSCPSLMADGERVAFGRGSEIWTARLDGSDPRRLEGVPSNYHNVYTRRCPAVSPDGKEVVFFQPEAGPYGDLWLLSLAGGAARRLTFDSAEAGSPVWTRDGRFIVFSSSRRGSRTLWRVAAAGGAPEVITTGTGDDLEPDVSAGDAIIYTATKVTYRLTLFDPSQGRHRELLERRGEINGQAFSPEGDRIAFFGLTEKGTHLFTVRTDGTELRQVTQVERERNVMPQWSRDGTSLYYYRQLPSPSFRKIPAAGGASATVVDGWTWEEHNGARWDTSERFLAYARIASGRPQATLLRDMETGAEQPLGRAFYSPKWSQDGALLLGNDWEGRILLCPRDGAACQEVTEGRSASWSGDGSRIYFQRRGRPLDDPSLRSVELWAVERDGRNPSRVTVLEPQHAFSTPAAVSRTDQIAWVQVRREKPELWLAEPDR